MKNIYKLINKIINSNKFVTSFFVHKRKQIITSFRVSIFVLLIFVKQVNAQDIEAGISGQLTVNQINIQYDSRVDQLRKFLSEHNSPLTDYADEFVQYADKYELGENWALIPAIAGVESTFGKHIPNNSYNAWGWGIPTGSRSGIGFDNWEDGIETVTKGLKERYINRGLNSLDRIGRVYAPPSNTWAKNVQFFMEKIEGKSPDPILSI